MSNQERAPALRHHGPQAARGFQAFGRREQTSSAKKEKLTLMLLMSMMKMMKRIRTMRVMSGLKVMLQLLMLEMAA